MSWAIFLKSDWLGDCCHKVAGTTATNPRTKSVTRCDEPVFRSVASQFSVVNTCSTRPRQQLEFGEFVWSAVQSTTAHKPHKAHANIICNRYGIFFVFPKFTPSWAWRTPLQCSGVNRWGSSEFNCILCFIYMQFYPESYRIGWIDSSLQFL